MSIHSELLYSIDNTQIFLDISNQSRNFSLIKTARANQDQRALIRVHYKLDYRKVKTVPFPAVRFLLGRGGPNEDPQISAAIKKEIEEFGDIIVGSFEDTYDNLPLKVFHYYFTVQSSLYILTDLAKVRNGYGMRDFIRWKNPNYGYFEAKSQIPLHRISWGHRKS